MSFKKYLRDKWKTIVLLLFGIITTQIFLLIYDINIFIRIYIALIILLMYFIGVFVEYYKEKTFYEDAKLKIDSLEEKYLIVEMLNKANFFGGKILKQVLEDTNKSMLENVNKYKYLQEEYKDYIELWIHEIKLPIATSKMIIENNKNEITQRIDEELKEIEDYVEQALYYARSNTANKDYCITKYSLKAIVNEVIKKNKQVLINQKIKINMHDIEKTVYIDPKWCNFILNQIIQNSIKYRNQETPEIEFWAEDRKESIILFIKDNGIGIKKGEITRVFDKGFTGTNGRIGRKSTGIGLYLCKKLCDKLGLGLELNSEKNVGTEVKIVFPKNSYIEGAS